MDADGAGDDGVDNNDGDGRIRRGWQMCNICKTIPKSNIFSHSTVMLLVCLFNLVHMHICIWLLYRRSIESLFFFHSFLFTISTDIYTHVYTFHVVIYVCFSASAVPST